MNNISFNPVITTNARGGFVTDFNGLIQGTAMADPAIRNALAGGVLNPSETLPMWGGVGITEDIPGGAGRPAPELGGYVKRAPSLVGASALTGFSVFDQAHNMINTPQSEVPLSAAYMMVNFYRLGSGARIAVACDPSLVALEGGIITPQVSWDFNGQRLVPGVAAYPANVITNAVWAAGVVTLTTTTAHGVGVGNDVSISGFTPAAYNGDFTTLAGTAGSTIKYALAQDPGADTVQGQLDAGGGLLPCKILGPVSVGNSLTVVYDPATGYATWNPDGTAVVIQI